MTTPRAAVLLDDLTFGQHSYDGAASVLEKALSEAEEAARRQALTSAVQDIIAGQLAGLPSSARGAVIRWLEERRD